MFQTDCIKHVFQCVPISDMFKGNDESNVADIAFEIWQRKSSHNFVTIQYIQFYGFASKCCIFKLSKSGVKNSKLKFFDM